MELRLLKVFSAIAESGSLVTAAAKLHLTPSAISHSLRALETDLGCRLFERVGKRMVLNQAGDQLLLAVRDPLNALEAAAEEVKKLGKWGQSRLRLGAPSSIAEHVLPRVIRDLKKTHPSLELQISCGDTEQQLRFVRESKVDLAICVEPDNGVGLDIRHAFRDELMFICPPNHPWMDGQPITREQLAKQTFISFTRASFTTRIFLDHLRGLNVNPKLMVESDSARVILELVKFDMGVAVMAPWAVDHEIARGNLKAIPVSTKPLKRDWCIVSLAVRPKSYMEEAFCKLFRNQTASLRLDRKDIPGK